MEGGPLGMSLSDRGSGGSGSGNGGPLGVSSSDRGNGSDHGRELGVSISDRTGTESERGGGARNQTMGELRNSRRGQGNEQQRGQQMTSHSTGTSTRMDYSMLQDYKMEEGVPVTRTTTAPNNTNPATRVSTGGSSSALSVSGSRRDETSLNRLDDSDRRDGQGPDTQEQRRKANEDDDHELVAEAVGGRAYLKASRSVWVMRFIVVFTFIGEFKFSPCVWGAGF